ncbi:MAG: hypothetical protein JXA87_00285 [Thermoleophilia bacterium]|nr:hypothetical protein [Thermoleophilia bacterium]
MGWLRGLSRSKEKALFRTHKPPFRSPDWEVGRTVQHEGKVYRVTRWEELRPVRLRRGGSVGEWEVWGRELSKDEMRREMIDEAERVLGDRGQGPAK